MIKVQSLNVLSDKLNKTLKAEPRLLDYLITAILNDAFYYCRKIYVIIQYILHVLFTYITGYECL